MGTEKTAIDRFVREAKRDAKAFAARGLPYKGETELLSLIADPKTDSHLLAEELDLVANWHVRIAYGQILESGSSPLGVANGLALRTIAALFRERSFAASAKRFGTLSAFRDGVRRTAASGFWDLIWCVWSRHALELAHNWKQAADVVAVCDIRRDFEVCKDEEHYRFPFEVTWFLALEKIVAADVETLNEVPQLRGVASAWDDDKAFSVLTQRWCDWHFEFSVPRRDDPWCFALTPHDFLFPSWIFAIDRCRQKMLGRSALGQHELIDFGRRFIEAISAESAPLPKVLVKAQEKYDDVFGGKPLDMVGFWKEFAARG